MTPASRSTGASTPQARERLPTEVRAVSWRGVPLSTVGLHEAVETILRWAQHAQRGRYVCVANVHVTMEALDDEDYLGVLGEASMVTTDGMPLVWLLRALGHSAERVYGPALTRELLAQAAPRCVPVGFFGSDEKTLGTLIGRLRSEYPTLDIRAAISPPFRELTPEDDRRFCKQLADSGAQIVFVGLGCPKQEIWMSRNASRLPAVLVGVGAAFDFIAGTKPTAPQLLQRVGLEWAFRLASEPRRLWRRYAKHNPHFVIRALGDVLRARRPGGHS
jgi:N-acetylglucosaminyldiphosphoundecaprenol N-acetyl-beta-D-mannosaminyltransferase